MGWGLGRVMFGLEASEVGIGLKNMVSACVYEANLVEKHIWVGAWGGSCLVLRRPKSGLVFKNMVSACVLRSKPSRKNTSGLGPGEGHVWS